MDGPSKLLYLQYLAPVFREIALSWNCDVTKCLQKMESDFALAPPLRFPLKVKVFFLSYFLLTCFIILRSPPLISRHCLTDRKDWKEGFVIMFLYSKSSACNLLSWTGHIFLFL